MYISNFLLTSLRNDNFPKLIRGVFIEPEVLSYLIVCVLVDHPLEDLGSPQHPLIDLVITALLWSLQQPPPHGLNLLGETL